MREQRLREVNSFVQVIQQKKKQQNEDLNWSIMIPASVQLQLSLYAHDLVAYRRQKCPGSLASLEWVSSLSVWSRMVVRSTVPYKMLKGYRKQEGFYYKMSRAHAYHLHAIWLILIIFGHNFQICFLLAFDNIYFLLQHIRIIFRFIPSCHQSSL